jgi:hypothetical protein
MSATTFEEAKKCPRCATPGEDRKTQSAAIRGATVHHIYCVNENCKWYNTPWLVQVNADGSIPPPTNHKGKDKVYVGFEDHDGLAKQLVDAIKRDDAASVEKGSEIRRRMGR